MGYVVVKVKEGDKIKCIDNQTYRRQYGSGDDWSVPESIVVGKTYTVVSVARDYFGSNKVVLKVGKENLVVDLLFMDGSTYKQRFEKVGAPGEDLAWVC